MKKSTKSKKTVKKVANKKVSREELFQENFHVVKIIASKYLSWKEPFDDLVQIGSIGLVKAIDRFSKKQGKKLKTYASALIEGEIRHYLRDKLTGVKVSRKLIELNAKVNKVIAKEQGSSNAVVCMKKIAKKVKIKASRIEDARTAVMTNNTLSLDNNFSTLKGSKSAVITLEDTVGNEGPYEEILDKVRVGNALNELPVRNRNIIKMLYFDNVVQNDIAKKFKVTQAQVSRIITQSLGQLREVLV